MSNGSDPAGDTYADILRAGIEQLIRVWRDEAQTQVRNGERKAAEWSNQILRCSNTEEHGLAFAASQAARLLYTKRRVPQVSLYVPTTLVDATGSMRPNFGYTESLLGLHLGKCVLITGGSAGIGGELGRLLAIAGARVMLTARRKDQLEGMRERIVRELEEIGYNRPHDRVQILADIDVAYAQSGVPAAVISTPFAPIPKALFGVEGADHLDAREFSALIETNLTHHYRVARKVSLFPGTRVILVSPDVPAGGTHAQFAMANFVKTTLHAFTATLGVENERLPMAVPVNQINLTRRMRSEEPRDAAEQAEEYERFGSAVLLAAAPIVEAQESRYRTRIYRGLAITV